MQFIIVIGLQITSLSIYQPAMCFLLLIFASFAPSEIHDGISIRSALKFFLIFYGSMLAYFIGHKLVCTAIICIFNT